MGIHSMHDMYNLPKKSGEGDVAINYELGKETLHLRDPSKIIPPRPKSACALTASKWTRPKRTSDDPTIDDNYRAVEGYDTIDPRKVTVISARGTDTQGGSASSGTREARQGGRHKRAQRSTSTPSGKDLYSEQIDPALESARHSVMDECEQIHQPKYRTEFHGLTPGQVSGLTLDKRAEYKEYWRRKARIPTTKQFPYQYCVGWAPFKPRRKPQFSYNPLTHGKSLSLLFP